MPAWFLREGCLSFVLALGHFLWQGTLIAAGLAIVLRVTNSVRSRYWLSLGALLLMAACPAVTLAWLLTAFPPSHVAAVRNDRGGPAANRPPTQEAARDSVAGPKDARPSSPQEAGGAAFVPPALDRRWWARFAPQLTAAYLSGVALMLLRLVVGLWGGRRLRRRIRLIDDPSLLSAMRRQAAALGLKLLPVLAYCERVTVPTVVGVLKPMVLLPATLTSGLSPAEIESVLAHELAHLRRCDPLVNLLQRVIESLLFFHPAMWWVSQRVREEREHCCDDLVVACGATPLDYAKSLLIVAELSRASQPGRMVAAVSLSAAGDSPSKLRQRIARLLGEPATPLRVSPRGLVLSIGVPLLAFVATIRSGASNPESSAPNQDEPSRVATLTPLDKASMTECQALIRQLDDVGEVKLAAMARERLAKRWKWITEQPVTSFLRELPKPGPIGEPNLRGEQVGVQPDLDGVWTDGKGTADHWKDWIVRKQNDYRVGRLHMLFAAAQGYRQANDAASAKRVLQAGLTGHEIYDANLKMLLRKYWPVADDEPEKSLGPGPEAWTLANYLAELSSAQQELGEFEQAVVTHSRLTLAHFMLSWKHPSAGPTKCARELWSLIRRQPQPTAPLFWFNVVDERHPQRKLDLSTAGRKGQPLTHHHENIAAAAPLEFAELKITAKSRGRKGFLDCYRINAEGKHHSIGLLQPTATGESPETLTKTIEVPAGTSLVQFMVAGDDFQVGEVTVEATFAKPGSSASASRSFSETKELVLSINSLKYMLDLDAGQTMDPPQKFRPEQERMDVHPLDSRPNEVPAGLQGLSLRGVRTKPEAWSVSVAELQKELASERVGPLKKLPYDANERATYFFRTADGTEGVLQMLAQTDDPKGIRLRYKTVAPAKLSAKGSGPRNSIPALGPTPLTLEFALPVAQAATDDDRLFSFFLASAGTDMRRLAPNR